MKNQFVTVDSIGSGTVYNSVNKSDMEKINMAESNVAKNNEFIKDLKKDIYLEETLYILRDMINLEKSFVSLQPKIIK